MDQTNRRTQARYWLVAVSLLAAWVMWKVYKFHLMRTYGAFSWEYWRPTVIVSAVMAATWLVTQFRHGDEERRQGR